MSANLESSFKEKRDELKRRIDALTVRVNLARQKYLQELPPKTQNTPRLLPTSSRPTPTRPLSTSSRPTPTPPPPSTSSRPTPTPPPPPTGLGPILLHPFPFPPPLHPPPTIPLPPLPPTQHFPKPPTREPSGTARCIEAGHMAADFIDALPEGCRRIALLVFDNRHPPIERLNTQFPPPPERRSKVVRGRRNLVPVRRHRRQPLALAVVPEE